MYNLLRKLVVNLLLRLYVGKLLRKLCAAETLTSDKWEIMQA